MTPSSPVVTAMPAIPVAARDGMLLNLSGAHAPFFTRNIVILTDNLPATLAWAKCLGAKKFAKPWKTPAP